MTVALPMNDNLSPRVAVCLAAYNGTPYLREQLDSILDQKGVAVTVFVSVDRSTDGTEEWVSEYRVRHPELVVLPTGQRFGGAAQNFFRIVQDVNFDAFEYVAFADQDDIWLADKLTRAVTCLTAEDAQGYSSDVIAFWASGESRYIRKSFPQRSWDYYFESAGPGCTFVMRKLLITELQTFLRDHSGQLSDVGLHDWFTYAFARARGHRWYIDQQAYMMYRQHGTNQVGVNAGWAAFLWRVRQVLNGWGLNQARGIALLVAPNDPFVAQWIGGGRGALWYLLRQSWNCRRRPLDRIWFAASCAALWLMGWK